MSSDHKYLILQNPGHNRVYYNAAGKLALAELSISFRRLSVKCSHSRIVEIEGVRYISFEAEKLLTENDLHILSRLSFVFAVFMTDKICGKEYLMPIRLINYEYLDGKISSLLKYPGKTNELFTKMMVNVALLSSDFSYHNPISLLDPVAGRGTTVYESAVYGFNSYGVDIEPNSVHEASIFFKKYLEAERLKHKSSKRRVAGARKSEATELNEFIFANSKEAFKTEENLKRVGFVCGNTMEIDRYFTKNSFHIITGDLPYGIAHGNASGKRTGGITRNPSSLLQESLPAWHKVIKPGGSVVVAWNSFLVPRKRMADIFKEHGFVALEEEPYTMFEHLVNKSIKRDIVVAHKK